MTTFHGSDLIERLGWRYATKKFDPARKVSDADLATLEKALLLAPSSYGLQPYKVIVVRDAELKKKLRAAAWNQPQVEDASHVVIFTAKKAITEADVTAFLKLTTDTRRLPPGTLDSYQGMMVGDLVKGPRAAWIDQWTARQAYIALGVLLTTAANLQIDACPMEGFVPPTFDEILGIQDSDYRSVVMAPIGYRAADDEFAKFAKVRVPASELISHR